MNKLACILTKQLFKEIKCEVFILSQCSLVATKCPILNSVDVFVEVYHYIFLYNFNFSLAKVDSSNLLITFANSLDQDHDKKNAGPTLDPNCLSL